MNKCLPIKISKNKRNLIFIIKKRRPVMISGSSSDIKKSELAFANPDSIN